MAEEGLGDQGNQRVAPGVGFAYDTAVTKLAEQLKSLEHLDTKLAALIAIVGAVTGLYAVNAKTNVERLAGVPLLFALTCICLAFLVRNYDNAPNPIVLARYAGYEPDLIKQIFLKSVLDAFQTNARRRRTKALLVNASIVALTLLGLLTLLTRMLGLQ